MHLGRQVLIGLLMLWTWQQRGEEPRGQGRRSPARSVRHADAQAHTQEGVRVSSGRQADGSRDPGESHELLSDPSLMDGPVSCRCFVFVQPRVALRPCPGCWVVWRRRTTRTTWTTCRCTRTRRRWSRSCSSPYPRSTSSPCREGPGPSAWVGATGRAGRQGRAGGPCWEGWR